MLYCTVRVAACEDTGGSRSVSLSPVVDNGNTEEPSFYLGISM